MPSFSTIPTMEPACFKIASACAAKSRKADNTVSTPDWLASSESIQFGSRACKSRHVVRPFFRCHLFRCHRQWNSFFKSPPVRSWCRDGPCRRRSNSSVRSKFGHTLRSPVPSIPRTNSLRARHNGFGDCLQRHDAIHGVAFNGFVGHSEYDAGCLVLSDRNPPACFISSIPRGAVVSHSRKDDAHGILSRISARAERNRTSTEGRCRHTSGPSLIRRSSVRRCA